MEQIKDITSSCDVRIIDGTINVGIVYDNVLVCVGAKPDDPNGICWTGCLECEGEINEEMRSRLMKIWSNESNIRRNEGKWCCYRYEKQVNYNNCTKPATINRLVKGIVEIFEMLSNS